MKKSIVFGLILMPLLFFSCRKVIDLKVNDMNPLYVIDADYDAVTETVIVSISQTKNVFSEEDYPRIIGASVEIIDANGNATFLEDQGDGTYLLEEYPPIFNSTYRMNVQIEDEFFEASDFLPEIAPFDSLVFEFREPIPLYGSGFIAFLYLTDAPQENYYRALVTINDTLVDRPGDQLIFDDSMISGNQMKMPYPGVFEEKDTLRVDLISYSKNSYEYYIGLYSIAASSSATAAPANPPLRWSNGALGHFSAYGYDTKISVAKKE